MDKAMNKEIKIAIIDSGIDLNRKEWNDADIVCLNDCHDKIGHGTAVASIIHQHADYAKLHIYNLFSNTGRVDAKGLTSVLEQLNSYTHTHFDIIHLSCGIVANDEIEALHNAVIKISNTGTIFVAAYDNEGSISYPAAFNEVIGVDWNDRCSNGMQYIFVKNSPVNILGTGSMQRLPWKDGTHKYVAGSSFAAPYITAIVARLIKSGVTQFNNVLTCLKENACQIWDTNNTEYLEKRNPVKIKKAILYPFNKEIHSIATNPEVLPFSIHGVYEPGFFRHVGQSVSEILKYGNSNLVIQSDKKINWTDDFDTVILGHTKVISQAIHKDILAEMIEHCIHYKKNLYSFDSLQPFEKQISLLEQEGCWVFHPKIDKTDVDKSFMGKLYRISSPVVGVFGTSPKQGKFTLQISLKKKMSEIGYRLGGLVSEPSALLFGFDYTYPMGYERSVYISGSEAVQTVNRLMHEIDKKQYNLIIVGSQSQTIPYNMGNVGFYPMYQQEFLLGTEPDAIVLCINPFDEISYIKRTIAYLENYIDTKVIALSLYPGSRTSDWDVQWTQMEALSPGSLIERKAFYTDNLNLPCYLLGDDKELDNLIDNITDFFVS